MSIRGAVAWTLCLALLLSACGGSSGSAPGDAVDQVLDSAVDQSESGPPNMVEQIQEGVVVSVAETSMGTILVDGNGFALYVLTEDLLNTPSCYGECQATWPPLLTIGAPEAGDGIEAEKLGVATRNDGTFQVSYAGKPLYLHVSDVAPGDTFGHGLGDVWLVLSPSGIPLGGTVGDTTSGTEIEAGEEEYNPDAYY